MGQSTDWFEGHVNLADVHDPMPMPEQRHTCMVWRIVAWVLILGLAIAFAALGGAKAVYSAERWITVNGLAAHLSSGDHCNSVTTGLGADLRDVGDWRTVFGFYRNSNCRWSLYAGGAWMPLRIGDFYLGAVAGLATGYKSNVVPAPGFAASWEGAIYGANATLIPPFNGSGNVLWLQVKRRW